MDFIPLVMIPLIYLGVATVRPQMKEAIGWSPCAICTAVSFTWFILAMMWFFGARVSEEIIGILMGMSVAGLMYTLEPFYKKKRIRNFWFVRIALIVGGFYMILFFLEKRWDALTLVAILAIMLMVIASFLFQGITHEDAVAELHGKTKKSLIKKLEDCC